MSSSHAPNYEGDNAEKFDAAWSDIEGVVTKFKKSLDDGFQVQDLGTWHSLIVDSYDTAKVVFGGDFDKEELTDLVVYIYWAIDPNWPWIPGVVEKPAERLFLERLAIPLAVGAAWEAVAGYIKSRDGKSEG